MTSTREIADLEREYRSFDWPRPVFELALRWLRDHLRALAGGGGRVTTVLAPGDKGQIKCRECGKVFAAWERSGVGRERSGWVMLRAHVNQYHTRSQPRGECGGGGVVCRERGDPE